MRVILIISILVMKLGGIYSQTNCTKYSGDYIPKNLNDALKYLDCTWSVKDKENFKNKKEKDAVSELHFGTGQGIRNDWGLWRKRRNSLRRYFKRLGIFHPDDIFSIILTSFHRRLNNENLDLETQAKYYKDYWEKVKIESEQIEKRQQIENEREFESIEVEDTVKIAFKIHDKGNYAVAYRIQKYPSLDEEPNCYLLGIVKGKKNRTRKLGKYVLTILIHNMCGYKEVSFRGIVDKLRVNEEYNFFSLEYFKIEKK